MSSTKYDVVVYGATSFAGQLVCEYYLTTYGASPPTFKWAMAARYVYYYVLLFSVIIGGCLDRLLLAPLAGACIGPP